MRGKIVEVTILFAVALTPSCSSPTRDAESLIRADMLDPDATNFRNVKEFGACVGGELNAKNRMGAYSGFRPFLVDLKSKKHAILPGYRAGSQEEAIAQARFKVLLYDCDLDAEQFAKSIGID